MVVEDPLLLFWSLLCWVEAMPMVLCKLACVCGPCCPRLEFPAARERDGAQRLGDAVKALAYDLRHRLLTLSPAGPRTRHLPRKLGSPDGPKAPGAHTRIPSPVLRVQLASAAECKRAERAAECQYERQVLRGCVPSRSARSKACDMCAHAGDKGLQMHACTIAE